MPRDPRGRKPTCHCGQCAKCSTRDHNRDYMRLYNQGIRIRSAFTTEEDALLGTDTDKAIGARIGRTAKAVGKRRYRLGIPAHIKRGRTTTTAGYIVTVLAPDDPLVDMCRSNRQVQEHRLVMARHLSRPLTRDEFVHHRNGIKTDNRIENLELWTRSHPDGQRVEDVFEWAIEFIERYAREIAERRDTSIFNTARGR